LSVGSSTVLGKKKGGQVTKLRRKNKFLRKDQNVHADWGRNGVGEGGEEKETRCGGEMKILLRAKSGRRGRRERGV